MPVFPSLAVNARARSGRRAAARLMDGCIGLLMAGSAFLAAQSGAGQGQSAREAMWPAPTAANWAKPCLITWQRTYEDAQAVSDATGKPILICVNMDGEIASEHYAGIRYRQPGIQALYDPYVTVIASVYRHTDRDYDELGRRILCPRFGSVTCGEHIAIEPGLFERFLDGQRVAPRHIGVELDGEEIYDIFYAFDTDSVFQAIEEGITQRPDTAKPDQRGDRSLAELALSADVKDRELIEDMWMKGGGDRLKTLMRAAVDAGANAPVELLRLASPASASRMDSRRHCGTAPRVRPDCRCWASWREPGARRTR